MDSVDRFCEATGEENRKVAYIYLDLYGTLDAAVQAFRLRITPQMVDTIPQHRARSVSKSDLLISSFRTMAGQEVATEVAISYLEQCGWELNKAIIKFKEEHGLKSKTICLSHSPRHSHIGKLEDERLQTQASLGYRDEYCLNDEGQGSTSSLVKAETRFTYKNALDEMIPLPVPQIAKMQQSQEDDLHSFVAHGVSREEDNAILDKWDWNVDQANNYVMDKRHPNKTSDDEKTPTASLPLMGLPVATPQMTVSAQDKVVIFFSFSALFTTSLFSPTVFA